MGRAPLAWQLSPPAPLHPSSPISPSVLVSSDRVRNRKTPSIPHPGPKAYRGPDREGIEGLTKRTRGGWGGGVEGMGGDAI